MNKHIFFSFLLALVVLGTACKKFEDPKYETPKFSTEGKQIHQAWELVGMAPSSGYRSIDTNDFYVEGVVISSDEGNNFYKEIVIAGQNGGFWLQVNRSGLYTEFPVGQKVYVNCKNLFITNDNGAVKVGVIYRDGIGQISVYDLPNHLYKDGLPSEENLNMVEITSISAAYAFDEGNVGQLVRLKNVDFAPETLGKPLANANYTTNLAIPTIDGVPVSNVVLRTSNYADFRMMTVPDSACTLTGVLSIYRNTYQLLLRTKEDIQF